MTRLRKLLLPSLLVPVSVPASAPVSAPVRVLALAWLLAAATTACAGAAGEEPVEGPLSLQTQAIEGVPSAAYDDFRGIETMVTVRGSEKESTVDVYANNRLESGASPITINWRRSLAQVRAGAAIGFRFEEPLPRYGGRGVVESVRIFSRVDDGPIEAVDVAAGGPGAGFRAEYDSGVNYLVRAPQSAKQRVEFWAEVAFREGDGPLAGRRVWESHQSKNFVVEVVPSAPVARVQFDAPAATGFPGAAASGRAAAGGALEVVYDTARMDAIRGERNEGSASATRTPARRSTSPARAASSRFATTKVASFAACSSSARLRRTRRGAPACGSPKGRRARRCGSARRAPFRTRPASFGKSTIPTSGRTSS
jgi:hypothetical protein